MEKAGASAAPGTLTLIDPNDSKAVRQAIFQLAGPALVEMVLINIMQMLNMVMVGRLGAESIAAVGLTTQPFLLILSLFMALNIGTTVIVARSVGAGKVADANKAAGQALLLNGICAVVVSFTSFMFAEQLLVLMGATPNVLEAGRHYAGLMFLSAGFTMITTTMSAILRGAGDTRTPMRINVAGNLIVLVLGFPLIYGWAGFPQWGVTGAAVASLTAQAVSFVWVMIVLFSGKSAVRITLPNVFQVNREVIGRIVRIGLPTSLEQVIMRLGMLTFIKIAASLGTVALASTQISFTIFGMTFMPGMAFSIAASTLVGQALGAEKPELAERYGWQVRKFGMYVAGGLGVGFILFAPYIMMAFTTDPGIIEKGAIALRIMGFIQISQATQFILGGALRAAGDTRFPLYSTLIGVWGFRVLFSLIFVYGFGWDVAGLWLAAAADQFMRSIFIYTRFKKGAWKTVAV
ncbi:MATE family efflux transporter [Paenibacillus silviterrae]|uniref:MATE family efflux transporter n=1 Tax=Paenibacillus silviterrae TaxID=3242194 RepID=UPI002542AE90|nr:MATE family efflux transporter [Paenibacillus chinjuensis]